MILMGNMLTSLNSSSKKMSKAYGDINNNKKKDNRYLGKRHQQRNTIGFFSLCWGLHSFTICHCCYAAKL